MEVILNIKTESYKKLDKVCKDKFNKNLEEVLSEEINEESFLELMGWENI